MNTTENNQLIASFLGQTSTIYEFPQFGYIKSNGDWKDTFSASELKFHSDWNWLMEVVEKIESLEVDKITFDFFITQEKAHIHYCKNNEWFSNIFISEGKSKIQNTYNNCVEFIKWYNQQNQ